MTIKEKFGEFVEQNRFRVGCTAALATVYLGATLAVSVLYYSVKFPFDLAMGGQVKKNKGIVQDIRELNMPNGGYARIGKFQTIDGLTLDLVDDISTLDKKFFPNALNGVKKGDVADIIYRQTTLLGYDFNNPIKITKAKLN